MAKSLQFPLTKATAAFLSLGLLAASGIMSGLLSSMPMFATHTECSDGIDNDGDEKFDYPEDPDCRSLNWDQEGPETSALFLSITDGKETVNRNDTLIYVIRLRSQREEARTVDVDLHLPAPANLVSADQGGRVIDGRVHWDNVYVERNHVVLLQVQMQVPRTATKELSLLGGANRLRPVNVQCGT